MSPLQWFVVIQSILGILTTVALIGKPRQAITAGSAAVMVAFNLVFIALALTVLAP